MGDIYTVLFYPNTGRISNEYIFINSMWANHRIISEIRNNFNCYCNFSNGSIISNVVLGRWTMAGHFDLILYHCSLLVVSIRIQLIASFFTLALRSSSHSRTLFSITCFRSFHPSLVSDYHHKFSELSIR